MATVAVDVVAYAITAFERYTEGSGLLRQMEAAIEAQDQAAFDRLAEQVEPLHRRIKAGTHAACFLREQPCCRSCSTLLASAIALNLYVRGRLLQDHARCLEYYGDLLWVEEQMAKGGGEATT